MITPVFAMIYTRLVHISDMDTSWDIECGCIWKNEIWLQIKHWMNDDLICQYYLYH